MSTDSPANQPASATLEAALRYANLMLRVVPIRPGSKAPALPAWSEAASSDPTVILSWWHRWVDAGVGIVGGTELEPQKFLVIIDVDEHDPAQSGSRAIATLEDEIGALPKTPTVLTPTGGKHLYFWSPVQLTNGAGTGLPTGIDVRGVGGQVLAPPTSHPQGGAYQWDPELQLVDVKIAELPSTWVSKMTATPATNERIAPPSSASADTPPARAGVDDRPGTEWAHNTTWKELLEADHWTFIGHGGSGEEQWVRPGKDPSGGPSATVNFGGADRLVVHSTNAPIPETSYSKFGYYTEARFGGDWTAAVKSLDTNSMRSHAAATATAHSGPARSFQPVDLVPYLKGDYEQPAPDYLIRRGENIASGLIYKAAVNGFHGDSGIGKSWLALYALAERIQDGDSVMLIDLEDGASSILARLRLLGITADQIAAQLHYVRPTDPYGPDEVAYLCDLVALNDVTVCVIDSLGESFGLDGVNENNDNEVGPWLRAVARPLADAGAAVILVDHVTKTNEKPLHASGSKRKRAAITGASYFIGAKKPFSKEDGGRLTITCAKDRHGTYRSGDAVAHLDMTYLADRTVRVELVAAAPAELASNDAPSVLAARRVVDALRASGDKLSLRGVNALVRSDGFHASNQVISDGIELAKRRDCIVEEAGENRSRQFSYAKNWTGL